MDKPYSPIMSPLFALRKIRGEAVGKAAQLCAVAVERQLTIAKSMLAASRWVWGGVWVFENYLIGMLGGVGWF